MIVDNSYVRGELSLTAFSHILTDPRTQNIPLILETPAFDGPGSGLTEGMEVWAKEVEVLKRISDTMTAKDGDKNQEESGVLLGEWTEEIKEVVKEMRVHKEAKQMMREKRAKGSKGKAETEDDGGVEEDASCGSDHEK